MTVKQEERTLTSVYEAGFKLLNHSYKAGKIFSNLPRSNDSLSDLQLLTVPALSISYRKEIIRKYIAYSKLLSIASTGTMAWVVLNGFDDFNDDDKFELEKYFSVAEEYYDKKVDSKGLISLDPSSNWMKDTVREGALIENQAYYSKILDVLLRITDDDMYHFKKKRLLRSVRENMDGAYILDREDSPEIRPNNFIACFFAPELFRRDDWEKTFDANLKETELWLEWGGLRLLSQSDTDFDPEMDGSSWFFLNNMAAIVLLKLNDLKYHDKVKKIFDASGRNILWQEHTGRACEIKLTDRNEKKVEGLHGLTLSTFIYLYRMLY